MYKYGILSHSFPRLLQISKVLKSRSLQAQSSSSCQTNTVTQAVILASTELLTLASTVERSECVQQVQGMQDLL